MDITSIYAATAGGVFISLFLLRIRPYLMQLTSITLLLIAEHLTYPFLLRRYAVVGPWTRGGVLIHLIYAAINLLCLCFRALSLVNTAHRAGTLSLINMVALFASGHLSFYPATLGISRRICQQIHRATAWMAGILLSFHIIVMMEVTQGKFPLDKPNNLFGLIVRPSPS
jgi:hypothetical protein